jgi:pyruvate/2-oxoglutarate dehydrogenase complex dihydrolipoamide acyltransferase (E2) component
MTTELRIPKLGVSMEEGTLAAWIAADGDRVSEGAELYSLETDKTVQAIESPGSGVLRIIGKPGETYPVGELIGVLD